MENERINYLKIFKYDQKLEYQEAERAIFKRIEELLDDKEKMKKISKSEMSSGIHHLFKDMIKKRTYDNPVRKFLLSVLCHNMSNTAEKMLKTEYNIKGSSIDFSSKNYEILQTLYQQSRSNLDTANQITIDKDIPRTWVEISNQNIKQQKENILNDILQKLIERQKGTGRCYSQGINLMGKLLIDRKLKENKNMVLSDNEKDEIASKLDVITIVYDKIMDIFSFENLKSENNTFEKITKINGIQDSIDFLLNEIKQKTEKSDLPKEEKDKCLSLLFGSDLLAICVTPIEKIEEIKDSISPSNTENNSDFQKKENQYFKGTAEGLLNIWIESVKKIEGNITNENKMDKMADRVAKSIIRKSLMTMSTGKFLDFLINRLHMYSGGKINPIKNNKNETENNLFFKDLKKK